MTRAAYNSAEDILHPKSHVSLKALQPPRCLLVKAMFTLAEAWPHGGSPTVLAGLSTLPSMLAPLFSTCAIFCTLGTNSITVGARVPFFARWFCIGGVYNTGNISPRGPRLSGR